MAPRAIGAFFALAAAILFVVSVATSAWWTGHPTIGDHLTTAKTVDVGLLGASGCNSGGDQVCEEIPVDNTVMLVNYGELGVTALAVLFSFIVMVVAWRIADTRVPFANLSVFVTLIAAGGAAALLALGPGLETEAQVDVPIGWGLYAYGGAIV